MIAQFMNWKGCGRKWFWPNLKYYFRIFLELLKKPTRKPIRTASLWADI
jgi:hypothetical protein